jgi:hypothetical protein
MYSKPPDDAIVREDSAVASTMANIRHLINPGNGGAVAGKAIIAG